MKKLLVAACIVAAFAILALPMGEIARGQLPGGQRQIQPQTPSGQQSTGGQGQSGAVDPREHKGQPYGQPVAQSQQQTPPVIVFPRGDKAFQQDNGAVAAQARKAGTSKAEMDIIYQNVTIQVTVTNPCTTVCVGSVCYKKCY
jgi:hypothetical protein